MELNTCKLNTCHLLVQRCRHRGGDQAIWSNQQSFRRALWSSSRTLCSLSRYRLISMHTNETNGANLRCWNFACYIFPQGGSTWLVNTSTMRAMVCCLWPLIWWDAFCVLSLSHCWTSGSSINAKSSHFNAWLPSYSCLSSACRTPLSPSARAVTSWCLATWIRTNTTISHSQLTLIR